MDSKIKFERTPIWFSKPYVIIRGADSGVHSGTLVFYESREVELENTRRLWSWAGSLSLSELALYGPQKPAECKFSVTLPNILLLDVCEIIPCSKEGEEIIKSVPIQET